MPFRASPSGSYRFNSLKVAESSSALSYGWRGGEQRWLIKFLDYNSHFFSEILPENGTCKERHACIILCLFNYINNEFIGWLPSRDTSSYNVIINVVSDCVVGDFAEFSKRLSRIGAS